MPAAKYHTDAERLQARRDKQKRFYDKNKERRCKSSMEYAKERKKHSPIWWAVVSAKVRCKKKGLAFDLDEHSIVIPEFCPYLKIPIIPGKGKASDNSPSIDRIDCNGGYTMDNIQIISNKANRMKSNASIEELILFSENVLKRHKGN